MAAKESKGVSIWVVIGVVTPIVITLITAMISVSVSLGQGEVKDIQHDEKIEKLEAHDKEHDDRMERTNSKIFDKLLEIQLELKDKKDRDE